MSEQLFKAAVTVACLWFFILAAQFRNPEAAANWFHAFQSHLFELQMGAIE